LNFSCGGRTEPLTEYCNQAKILQTLCEFDRERRLRFRPVTAPNPCSKFFLTPLSVLCETRSAHSVLVFLTLSPSGGSPGLPFAARRIRRECGPCATLWLTLGREIQ
jgi:hypothetical protein